MFNRFYRVVLCLALLWPLPAAAQSCDPVRESITDLNFPAFGSYYVWDASYGSKDAQESFGTGMLARNGNVIAAGERIDANGKITLIIVEFDRRGRPVWEVSRDLKGLQNVVKIMPRKGGFLVLANQEESKGRSRAWFGFFSEEGKFVREKTVRDNAFSLTAHDMTESFDGKSYLLATTAKRTGSASGYSLLYWLDREGGVKADKAYMPGLENALYGVAAMEDGGYVAAGMMEGERGRKTGWAIRIDHEGNIIWQRQYPRGLAAKMNDVIRFGPDILIVGEAVTADRGKRAGWLMLLAGSGEIGWQKFYRSDFDVSARRVLAHKDGQISLLLGLENPPLQNEKDTALLKNKKIAYPRVLTLTPRGEVLVTDPYFQAEGSGGTDMFFGPNDERVLAGYADVAYNVEHTDVQGPGVNATEVQVSRNAWVVAGAPADAYMDPCVKMMRIRHER